MLLLLALATLCAPASAAPTPSDDAGPASVVYSYRGPAVEGDYTVEEILAFVRTAPRGKHEVMGHEVSGWTPWNQVPTLALAWLNGAPAPARATPTATPSAEAPPAEDVPAVEAPPEAAPAEGIPLPAASNAVPTAVVSPVTVGGDVRIDFNATNLERLGSTADGAAALGFNVSRARPIVDVRLGRWFSGRLAVEFRQDDSSVTYAENGPPFDVKNWASGWSIQGREVYLQAAGGDSFRHRLRVGLQEPAFGVRDAYEHTYRFAGEGRADLARREGLVPDEDLGVGWRGEIDDRWAFDVQLLNGSGGTTLDPNNGKDVIARVSASPLDVLTVSVSGLYGSRGGDGEGEQAQAEVTLEVHGPSQRLLLEGLLGTTSEDRLDTLYSGAAASGAWTFPVDSPVLDSFEIVGRFQFFDPVFGLDAPDAWWAPAAGAWLGWDVDAGHVVRVGATWEMFVPQDSLLPVTHDVIAEAAWSF